MLFRITGIMLCLIGIVPTGALAAPITFNTALPVSKGEYIVREMLVLNKSSDDPSGLNRDRQEVTVNTAIAYGLTPDIALFGVVPYTDRKLKTSTSTRDTAGLGDVRIFGRYTMYQEDFKGGTFRIAPFAGIELPTGENSARDALGKPPASVQAGSGSLDVFGGIVLTYGTTDWEIDTQLSYQKNNEADGFEGGDIARADASVQYKLFESVSSQNPWFLNGVLETSLIHKTKNETLSAKDTNTGGTTLTVAPGIQFITKRWIAEAGVQLPVVQNLNGTALKNDFMLFTGIRVNF